MGVLSRWSGSLLDRVGARVPLTAGPTIAAVGFALFALSGPSTSYWYAFLAPIAIIGLGMAVTVAPLTTTVINAVPGQQTGVASGINNAVASVATLLAIAIFGAVTINGFGHALDRDMQTPARQFRTRASAARHGFAGRPTMGSLCKKRPTNQGCLSKP
jgi:MFS family permease